MNNYFTLTTRKVFEKLRLTPSDISPERESNDYSACRFKLNDLNIVFRKAKITPKKAGQFVTFWKRNQRGIIEPLHESDAIDFYVINVTAGTRSGQFVFPRSVLITKGIMSTSTKEGKRGFRIYPSWDSPQNNQAKKTQSWQLKYFLELNGEADLEKVLDQFNKTT